MRPTLLGILGTIVLLWLGGSWLIASSVVQKASQSLVRDESTLVQRRAQNIAKNIAQSIMYLHGIPSLIAEDARTIKALDVASVRMTPMPAVLKQRVWSADPALRSVDGDLKLVAQSLRVDVVWIMDAAGDTLAASNAGGVQSFVGTNYADRQYFRTAMAGTPGEQYAMGRITDIPGLYFSAPVKRNGRVIGVVAAKTDVPKLSYWVNQAEAFISDIYGVVILAKDTNLEMHTMPGAPIGSLARSVRMERYKRAEFSPLSITSWGDAKLPELVRFGEDTVPNVMANGAVTDSGLAVHVVKRLPAIQAYETQRLQLFLLLAVSGSVLLLIVGGSLKVALIHREAGRSTAQALSLQLATLESTADGILVVDMGGHVTTYNRRFRDMWLIPSDLLSSHRDQELLDHACRQLVEPEQFMQKVRELYAHPDDSSYDVLHLQDGRIFERYSQPQRLEGQVVGRVWSFRDITERKRAEDRLAQSELKLKTIIDTEPECVKLLAEDGTVLQMNRAGLEMIDADTAEQVVGKSVEDIVAPKYRAAFYALTRRVFQGESGNLEFEIIGLKGTHRWFDTRAVPLRDTNGAIWALLGVTRDITERKRAELQIQRLNRLYAVLGAVSELMVHCEDVDALFSEACRITHEEGGLRMAWVGLVDPQSGHVKPVAHRGPVDHYLEHLQIDLGETARGRGPTGEAIRNGRPSVCNDIAKDERMQPWRAEALRMGYRSSACFPLRVAGVVQGTLCLYADTADFFDTEETRLLERLSQNIGLAWEVIEFEAYRRRTEEAVHRSEENLKRAQAVAQTGSWHLDIINDRLE
ncbi:MAG: PAS domain-containing protein, partial [Thiobacillaceae bacterium]